MPRLMKRLVILLSLTLILSLTFAGNIVAQDDDEIIDFVAEAMGNITQQESVFVISETVIAQDISMAGLPLPIEMTITQSTEVVNIYDDSELIAMQGTNSQSTEAPGFETFIPGGDLIIEMILVDEEFYMRVDDVDNAFGGIYPEGWVTADSLSATRGIDFTSFFTSAIAFESQYGFNEDVILSIEELDGEEINDMAMRVFALEYDIAGLMEGDALANILGGAGMDLSALGVDMNEMMQDMLDSMNISMTLWISEDDGLPYQIEMITTMEMEMTVTGQTMELIQDITQTTTYNDYNEPVEITAPDLD